ncbi:PRP38-domain-containing protein [Sodiomyces alkalinus F11]|uniref:Pre-mRNA-splicing factor 38 n=1 Tax=Sodiomyces alkalinus (strain CBS 110278 / VKM F-3762 / F11) TaxID=1314773 RepID=A0A3N2Q2N7_SODAK|nr:PRP38-domain-containing protein [Sodiomyces alkalinus F11]ROT40997.1 PRP38-domain-containing protein [Sodiomyces alkalinus F11]
MKSGRTVYANESRFLDERGTASELAPNGENPAKIMEKAVIGRIVDSQFYQYQCFALNEAGIVDRVVNDVHFIGGTYGAAQKPTPFLCLAFKLLQLAPADDVLEVYLGHGGERFKYLRALACFYIRMTRRPADVYRLLEPYLADRRKLRRKTRQGTSLTYMDEFVDDLLTKTRVCATSFRELPRRTDLVDLGELEERESPLGDIDELLEEEDERDQAEEEARQANGDDERSEGEIDGGRDGDGGEDRMDVDRRSRSRSRSPGRRERGETPDRSKS